MNNSVIDLCDSDSDGAAAPSFASAAARQTAEAEENDSEHSSSSSDIDLWNVGGSQHSRAVDLICFNHLSHVGLNYITSRTRIEQRAIADQTNATKGEEASKAAIERSYFL